MAQTIRLTAPAALATPRLYLWNLAGAAVGEVGGYALTEVAAGFYSITTVNDAVTLESSLGELRADGSSIGTDRVIEITSNEWWVGESTTASEVIVKINAGEAKSGLRGAISGRWTDEDGNNFDLSIQDLS